MINEICIKSWLSGKQPTSGAVVGRRHLLVLGQQLRRESGGGGCSGGVVGIIGGGLGGVWRVQESRGGGRFGGADQRRRCARRGRRVEQRRGDGRRRRMRSQASRRQDQWRAGDPVPRFCHRVVDQICKWVEMNQRKMLISGGRRNVVSVIITNRPGVFGYWAVICITGCGTDASLVNFKTNDCARWTRQTKYLWKIDSEQKRWLMLNEKKLAQQMIA